MHELLRVSVPLVPLLGLLLERRDSDDNLLTLGALPLLFSSAMTGTLDPVHAILGAVLSYRGWRKGEPLGTAAALGMLCFDDPRLILASGVGLLWSQGARRPIAIPLALSGIVAYFRWGDLTLPPQLHIHPQLGALIALLLILLLLLKHAPLFAGLLLLRGLSLTPEIWSLAAPWLIYLAPVMAVMALVTLDPRRACKLNHAAVILLGFVAASPLGILGATVAAVTLMLGLDEPRLDPITRLPGGGFGLAYVLYAAGTSLTLPGLPVLLVGLFIAAGWLGRLRLLLPALPITVALTALATLEAPDVGERTAAQLSRETPASDDRWGWRALWYRDQARQGGQDAGVKP